LLLLLQLLVLCVAVLLWFDVLLEQTVELGLYTHAGQKVQTPYIRLLSATASLPKCWLAAKVPLRCLP
jgi:hypothetical protein